MNKTKIEWCDYTINPVKGLCPMACDYCYARRMYKRFKWDEEILYLPPHHLLWNLGAIKKPSRIFLGSTMELFGNWIDPNYIAFLLGMIGNYPQHTFIFLTKQPQNLIKWSPFPENCWVGISATNAQTLNDGVISLSSIEASIKFASIEPLLSWKPLFSSIKFPPHINWVIIGQQTPINKRTSPKIEWIQEIVEACDKAKVPVFLKNNLRNLLPATAPFVTNPLRDIEFKLRQEFPK